MNKNNELLDLAYQKLATLEKALIVETKPEIVFELKYKINELKQSITELSGKEGGDLKKVDDISRLPKPSAKLVGRNEELEKLTMSLKEKNKNIAYICAAGGIGKSALTFQWLKNMQPKYCNVEKVFAWSFYSQGSHDTQNSSTAFFEEALPFFGCPKEKIPKDDTAKGRLLVKYLNNQSFILILDGLEPLQHRVNILDGELKDVGIRALIDELFYHGLKVENSLILISSRQPLKELEIWDEEKYLNLDLQTLNKKEGAILLKKLGVKGTTEGLEQEELEQTSEEWGGHALALVLLGKLLKNKFVGKVRFRNKLPTLWTEERLGGHALRILRFYEQQWSNNSYEYIFMVLMSLFDRPMGISEKQILVEKAEIAAPLRDLDEIAWEQLEITLESSGLLLSCDSPRIYWDCHPLIREYFNKQFNETYSQLFQQAHLILFEFYQQLPEKDQPDTLEELAPLYRAVVHGCLAGEYFKALHEIYLERIVRWQNKKTRNLEFYSTSKLGGYGEDLTTLAAFFPQGWSQPIQCNLSEEDQAWLLAAASSYLTSLGRLVEAVEPGEVNLQLWIKRQDWKGASISAQSLMTLYSFLGFLTKIISIARQSIQYSEQIEDEHEQIKNRIILATVKFQQGLIDAAWHEFQKIEQLWNKWQNQYPKLYGQHGFQYCALLLEQAQSIDEYNVVLKYGEYILGIALNNHKLLHISLGYLTLARAYFKLKELERAGSYFNQAVEGIREAGKTNFLPEFLIDRANFFLEINEIEKGLRDLSEAKQLISRSGMKLYEVDYHLAMCHFLIKTNPYKTSNMSSHAGAWELGNDAQAWESPAARSHAPAWEQKDAFDKHLNAAKTLIKSTGYHLRDKAVLELETQIKIPLNPLS